MKLGIIGGSGFESLTKFAGVDCVISRHGKKHNISPSNVDYVGNIKKMMKKGITHIISLTACGSLREELSPGTIVTPSQIIDKTYKRENTLYKNKVVHTSFGEPFDEDLRNKLEEATNECNFPVYPNRTLITIEGPRFSSKAESNLYRNLGGDIINMTTMPEAILAKEAGIKYQPLALVTDYDCWKEDEEEVTFEIVKKRLRENSLNALLVLEEFIYRRLNES
jgi:5'-methylthioadenosine phosphorylase